MASTVYETEISDGVSVSTLIKIKKLCSIIISFPLEGTLIAQNNRGELLENVLIWPGNHDQIQLLLLLPLFV